MGDMADFANEDQTQSLEDLLAYQSGDLSDDEAMGRGILDEHGYLDANAPNLWGVHDVESLRNELTKCELALATGQKSRRVVQVWRDSGGNVYLPKDMTTAHLVNAIAYAKRKNYSGEIISQMKQELANRESKPANRKPSPPVEFVDPETGKVYRLDQMDTIYLYETYFTEKRKDPSAPVIQQIEDELNSRKR